MARTTFARRPQTDDEWRDIERAIYRASGHTVETAEALGIDPRTLRRWFAARPELQALAASLRAKAGIQGPR